MHVELLFQRVTYSDPIMGDQLLSDDLVSEEFTFDRWPLLSGKTKYNIKDNLTKLD